ncbi:MAG: hypothetical protein H8E62_06730 [Planctomycetes bacterium]|nr:hypothetical protein [Planctomycetota bacterium]
MKNPDSLLIYNTDLYALFADNEMSDTEFDKIKALLKKNEVARDYYYHIVNLEVLLRDSEGLGEGFEELPGSSDMDFWHAMAQHEKTAPVMEVSEEKPQRERELIQHLVYPPKKKYVISRSSVFWLAMSAAAMLFFFLFLRFVPPKQYRVEVATLVDQMNVQWAQPEATLETGSRLWTNEAPLYLQKGIVKVQFDEGVEVLLEGPAAFEIDRKGLFLEYGHLYCRVSEIGLGFTVRTPTSEFIDMGTEFGVHADINGSSELHVTKGKVQLFAGKKGIPKTAKMVSGNKAVRYNANTGRTREIPIQTEAFARSFDSKAKFIWKGQQFLRLTDLLLGGNGFGTASLKSIQYEPATGTMVSVGIPEYREGSGEIMEIRQSPYLDGVFVPGSPDTDAIISSAGHHFDECPTTSGLYYSNIVFRKNCTFFDPLQQNFERSSKQFTDSGFLYLHSNMGLTVDLDAVRSEAPGCRIASFSAFAGIMNFLNNAEALDYAEVDIWVLVDGQLRTSRQGLRADQGYDIHVDLADQDRFLTLVVTDGGTPYLDESIANHFDSCGFAEPVFQLVSREKN